MDIFAAAITNMSISNGKNILFGADNAATEYLEINTYTQLQGAFEPTITASLSTVSVAGTTPVEAWSKAASINNGLSDLINKSSIVSTALSSLGLSLKPMEASLSDYVTGKALDGLFVKVAEEELKIRTDVSARKSDLLREVFGELDSK